MDAKKDIPTGWEPYLTGQVEAAPAGPRWVREQLTLYGLLSEEPHSPKPDQAQDASAPARPGIQGVSPPPPQEPQPTVNWSALRQWLQVYTMHLLGLNRAPLTLDAYRTDVDQFIAFCERQARLPLGVKRMDLLSHLAALAQQGYQASTRARKTYAIKGFFQFLVDAELLPQNPFATVPSPRLEQRERRVLTEAEYQALRELARQRGAREYAVVELFLQTGLRVSELCGLRLGDISFGEQGKPGAGLVRQGKGKKDRVVPLNSVAQRAVQGYLDTRADHHPASPLLVALVGTRPLRRQAVHSLLQRLFWRLGIEGASVHTLRHTFATHSLRTGVSLLVVKEVLGHRSVSTTERYLHLLRETMTQELEAHPF